MTHRCWPYPGEPCAMCEADPPLTWRDWLHVAGLALFLGAYLIALIVLVVAVSVVLA